VENDLPAFGEALTTIQRVTGAWFAPAQGGIFAPGRTSMLVARMAEWGAAGVGQSSWGPAVYGLVGTETAGRELAARARDLLEDEGRVFEGGFANSGARLWRAESAAARD
jgi:beta-ribofuranosylaminobenzene 5'-phosphate synthase